jgi:hypothetical protein
MTKETILKTVGIACIIGGAVCLYIAGVGESTVAAIVGGVFVLAAIIAAVIVGKVAKP